jgi:hypothetical protein
VRRSRLPQGRYGCAHGRVRGFAEKVAAGRRHEQGPYAKDRPDARKCALRSLLEYVERGDVDPSLIATHRVSLDEALGAYRLLKNKDQGCVRVVLRP